MGIAVPLPPEMKKSTLTTEGDYKQRVDRVTMYILEHLDCTIDIRTLAELSAFSPFHFHRIMRGYLGEPIGAFIVRTRVEAAATLLRYSNIAISDIAYRVGYGTPSSLTKAFVKLFGVSPTAYRTTKNYQIMAVQTPQTEVNLSKGKIVALEPKTVLCIRAKGSYNSVDFSTIFAQLWGEVKRQNVYTAGIEHIGVYHNNPEVTSAENLLSDVCLRVCKPVEPNGDVAVKEIPGGRFIVFTYTGAYTKVGAAYDKIYGELLAKNGVEPRGNYCMEKYVSDPRCTEPEKLKTEIYIPIDFD